MSYPRMGRRHQSQGPGCYPKLDRSPNPKVLTAQWFEATLHQSHPQDLTIRENWWNADKGLGKIRSSMPAPIIWTPILLTHVQLTTHILKSIIAACLPQARNTRRLTKN